jgi:hypothetical protein
MKSRIGIGNFSHSLYSHVPYGGRYIVCVTAWRHCILLRRQLTLLHLEAGKSNPNFDKQSGDGTTGVNMLLFYMLPILKY